MSATQTRDDEKYARPNIDLDPRLADVQRNIVSVLKGQMIANNITHDELMKALLWLTNLKPRELMGLCLVYLESTVIHHEDRDKPGTVKAVAGPYHLDDHPELEHPYRMPQRPEEPGVPFFLRLRIVDPDGNPISGAKVDCWHSSDDGSYSGFTGGAEPPNLRGIMYSDENGEIDVATIRPVPYLAMPPGHPLYEFFYRVGDHPWRPAHFHFKIHADDYESLIAQIYFEGDPILEGQGDPADSALQSQFIQIREDNDPKVAATFNLRTPYQTGQYTFVLRPAT